MQSSVSPILLEEVCPWLSVEGGTSTPASLTWSLLETSCWGGLFRRGGEKGVSTQEMLMGIFQRLQEFLAKQLVYNILFKLIKGFMQK